MDALGEQRLMVLLDRIAVSLEALTEKPMLGEEQKFPTVNLQVPASGANMKEFRESLDQILWHSQLGDISRTTLNSPPKK